MKKLHENVDVEMFLDLYLSMIVSKDELKILGLFFLSSNDLNII